MNELDFSLYFYYTKRKKLRDSFLLTFLLPFIQTMILSRYKESNYKYIEILIKIVKVVIATGLYVGLFLLSRSTADDAVGFSIFLSVFFAFFTCLILFASNKETIKSIEKDHYFRMIGENRNELIKQILKNRIKYATINWLIPLTFGPFLYVALLGDIEYLINFLLYIGLFYTLTTLVVFTTQRLYYETLRNVILIDVYVTYIGTSFVLLFSVGLPLALWIINIQFNLTWPLYIVVLISSFILLYTLNKIANKVIKKTINYSLTNIVVNDKRKKITENKIVKESRYLNILTKDEVVKTLFKKDYIKLVRTKKKPLFTMISLGLFSGAFCIFIISGILDTNEPIDLNSLYLIDNIFFIILLSFFITSFYRMKNDTWYSAEGINTSLYARFKIDKNTILKEKKLINYTLYLPMVLFFAIPPLLTLPFTSGLNSFYIIYRVFYIYLLLTLIIDYSLLKDIYNPRRFPHEPIAGMGSLNMNVLVGGLNGVGVTYLLMQFGDSIYLNNVMYTLLITQFSVVLLLKLYYIYKAKKLKGIYEGTKIYGNY